MKINLKKTCLDKTKIHLLFFILTVSILVGTIILNTKLAVFLYLGLFLLIFHYKHSNENIEIFDKVLFETFMLLGSYTFLFYAILQKKIFAWAVIFLLILDFLYICIKIVNYKKNQKLHKYFLILFSCLILLSNIKISKILILLLLGISIFIFCIFVKNNIKIDMKIFQNNLPNILTMSRIFLILPFLISLYNKYYLLGLLIFIVASITDFFDGYIARKYDLVTTFGKIADPLADKALVLAAFVMFLDLKFMPVFFVVIILGRELLISYFRIEVNKSNIDVAAIKSGKIKTVIQIMGIVIILIFKISAISFIVSLLIVGVTLYSGYDYVSTVFGSGRE